MYNEFPWLNYDLGTVHLSLSGASTKPDVEPNSFSVNFPNRRLEQALWYFILLLFYFSPSCNCLTEVKSFIPIDRNTNTLTYAQERERDTQRCIKIKRKTATVRIHSRINVEVPTYSGQIVLHFFTSTTFYKTLFSLNEISQSLWKTLTVLFPSRIWVKPPKITKASLCLKYQFILVWLLSKKDSTNILRLVSFMWLV